MVEESSTRLAVFIIESVKLEDEQSRRLEGEILKGILQLAEVPSEYWYIRTKKELQEILALFGDSNKRYLHISCHGNNRVLSTTFDRIDFPELRQLATPHIDGRRVFFSACEVVNRSLAAAILPGSGCLSIIGPKGRITFGDAAIMWASFYHLMFKLGRTSMKRQEIQRALRKVSTAFAVPLRYFGRRTKAPGFSHLEIVPEETLCRGLL